MIDTAYQKILENDTGCQKVTEIISVRDVYIGYVSLLPAEYDGHELDKYRDGDVGRADVGQKQEDRLGE